MISVTTFFRERVTSEEWLIRELGAYLPGVYEEVSNEAKNCFLQIYCIYSNDDNGIKLIVSSFCSLSQVLPSLIIIICMKLQINNYFSK